MTEGASFAALAEETRRRQASASDPQASAWVSANAGTGKTFVLSRRVLRLLLAGTAPDRILCLTYTKAAAAEMSRRVFDVLAGWALADEARLGRALAEMLSRPPAEAELVRARTLFALAIEAPGGLKIMTIHAFAERLLKRFPLEARVPPSFRVLEEGQARELMRGAIDAVLGDATREASSPLGQALDTAIAYAAGDGFDDVVAEVLARRETFVEFVRAGEDADYAAARRTIGDRLGVRREARQAEIVAEMARLLDPADLTRAIDVLGAGAKTDVDAAECLRRAAAAPSQARRVEALAGCFLTQEGKPRARVVTQQIRQSHPELAARLERVRDRFHVLDCERRGVAVLEATLAMLRLADAIAGRYAALKAGRAALDFADLIDGAVRLIGNGDDAQWVLYKLDGGIDHILVDEAQDTSEAQWRIVRQLAEEFFAGSGSSETLRTLFAVGDPKQSIYRFQGAMPRLFAVVGRAMAERIAAQGARFERIALEMSFRSAPPVLDAVDHVFAGEGAPPGIRQDGPPVRHIAQRHASAGVVEIWDTEKPEQAAASDAWDPLAEDGAGKPVDRLAQRIATTIRTWLDRGESLYPGGPPIAAGDILILVRKRAPFAEPMIRALKTRGVPVAGADRIRVADEPAVMDLKALMEFLLLPEDDLALATVLKSPISGFDDDDLLRLRSENRSSLWSALLRAAEADERMAGVARELKDWRARADYLPPYEFFAGLLDRDGVRTRLLRRLGPEAIEGIEEFLSLALHYDDGEAPSLQGFHAALGGGGAEVKRDMDQGRDEVRVMTVHGAKGLEAPIVFLADTCAAPASRRAGLVTLGEDAFVWAIKGSRRLDAIERAASAEAQEEAEEQDRLLYVAMTRARDRLYIAGFEGMNGRARGCWYDILSRRLAPRLQETSLSDGWKAWRLERRGTMAGPAERTGDERPTPPAPLPGWASRRAPAESERVIPVRPSGLAPFELEDGSLVPEHSPPAEPSRHRRPADPAQMRGLARGTLVHQLLQHLPQLPKAEREMAATSFLSLKTGAAADTARKLASEVIAVLDHPSFAEIFGPDSLAEVPIAADLAPPGGRGVSVRVVGSIDRLLVGPKRVFVVDYKTNRLPPRRVEDIPLAYLLQLAAYVQVLKSIYPGRAVAAALLWTETLDLMQLPDAVLADVTPELFKRDGALRS